MNDYKFVIPALDSKGRKKATVLDRCTVSSWHFYEHSRIAVNIWTLWSLNGLTSDYSIRLKPSK